MTVSYLILKKRGRISDTAAGFPGCDGTCSAPLALHFVPRCLQTALSRRPKFQFCPNKLVNSTFFVAGGNNKLELISNWTEKVYFLFSNKWGKSTIHGFNNKKKYLFLCKTVMIFAFYEQKNGEKVYLKLNLVQSTKQESPFISYKINGYFQEQFRIRRSL